MNEVKIGELIRERRKELGMSIYKLGSLVGVSGATVSRWETGYIKDIKRAQIYLLSKTLYIPIDTLLGLSKKTATENIEAKKLIIAIQSELEEIKDLEKLKTIKRLIEVIVK